MSDIKLKTEEEIKEFPMHMQGDYRVMNKNIKDGKDLCQHCGGTGNELFSMYRQCPTCYGKGFIETPQEVN